MKVSIIISVFNGERFIGRAIRSCIGQSMSKEYYEIIVVNDGSTDNTKHILESFGDWIRVITLEKNMGLPYACNIGIKKALSRYVIRVDADDYVHQDILTVASLHLDYNNNIDCVACDYNKVDDEENSLGRFSAEKHPIACGILFRKDRLLDIGLYDENFHLGEDEDLRIRFLKKHSITYIPLPLYRYRMHENNSTKNKHRVGEFKQKLKDKHNIYPR